MTAPSWLKTWAFAHGVSDTCVRFIAAKSLSLPGLVCLCLPEHRVVAAVVAVVAMESEKRGWPSTLLTKTSSRRTGPRDRSNARREAGDHGG